MRWVKIVLSLLVVFVVGSFVAGASAVGVKPAVAVKPQTKSKTAKPVTAKSIGLRISRDTTFLTKPLDQHGFVDYVAAINARNRKGVTPKNNAVVLLAEVMRLEIGSKKIHGKYFAKLGIPVPSEKIRYFLTMDNYAKKVAPQKTDAYYMKLGDQYDKYDSKPWSRKEAPELAAWIDSNKIPLAKVIKASKRSQWYSPVLDYDGDWKGSDLLVNVLLPFAQELYGTTRALTARAMLAVQENRIDDALTDLLACHRLARLVGQGYSLIPQLIGYGIEAMAYQSEQALLGSGKATSAQLTKYQQALAQLSAISTTAEKIRFDDRLVCLDIILMLARSKNGGDFHNRFYRMPSLSSLTELHSIRNIAIRGQRWLTIPTEQEKARERPVVLFQQYTSLNSCGQFACMQPQICFSQHYFLQATSPPSFLERFVGKMVLNGIDWNIVLKVINEAYDDEVAAYRKPKYRDRKIAADALWENQKKRRAELYGWYGRFSPKTLIQSSLFSYTKKQLREGMSKRFANIILALTMAPYFQCCADYYRTITKGKLSNIAIALEQHRLRTGRFPKKLADLVPREMKKIPVDPFSDKPFIYRPQPKDSRYLLYSVGPNLKDNAGKLDESDIEIVDDISMKIKMPKK